MHGHSMKLYTMHDAAETLGIDPETLNRWLVDSDLTAIPDPYNHQQYMLDEAQLEQLARQHNRSIAQNRNDGNGATQATMRQMPPETRQPTLPAASAQMSQPVEAQMPPWAGQ